MDGASCPLSCTLWRLQVLLVLLGASSPELCPGSDCVRRRTCSWCAGVQWWVGDVG